MNRIVTQSNAQMPSAAAQRGFTIIELLIATSVFAVVLLVVTTGIMQFTKQYYKGVIASSTQGVARTIVDDAARAIQYNPGEVFELKRTNPAQPVNPADPVVGYCIGGAKRYSFSLNTQVIDNGANAALHQARHGFVSDTVSGCNAGSVALDADSINTLTTNNARELLGQHMRLSKFNITSNGDMYDVEVRVVYGDDDLLCSPSAGDCNQTAMSTNLGNTDIACKSFTGSEFCAASELRTSVKKRVQ